MISEITSTILDRHKSDLLSNALQTRTLCIYFFRSNGISLDSLRNVHARMGYVMQSSNNYDIFNEMVYIETFFKEIGQPLDLIEC